MWKSMAPILLLTMLARMAVAANDASFDYSSGLMLAEYRHGAGRFLLSTLPIREQLARIIHGGVL
jgi:hypothetical protein